MGSQEQENIEFFRSQPQLLIAQSHGSLVEVDLEIPELHSTGQAKAFLHRVSRRRSVIRSGK
jgi:hypothetical protein